MWQQMYDAGYGQVGGFRVADDPEAIGKQYAVRGRIGKVLS
jgi:hypothetical protein